MTTTGNIITKIYGQNTFTYNVGEIITKKGSKKFCFVEQVTEFSAEDKVKFSSLDDTSFGFMSAQLRQFSAKTDDKPNTPNPALSNLFSHQATNGDKTQFNAPQSKSLVDLADKY